MALLSITINKDNLRYIFTTYDNKVYTIAISIIDDTQSHSKHKNKWARSMHSYMKANENITYNKIMLEALLNKYIEKHG